jgi:DNA sulfur modification protein DndB
MAKEASFEYVFPAIRGVQAGREYFASMCPLRLIPKVFLFNEEELVPELRAQRSLNKVRIPEMARYMTENNDSYVFSAITASIDGKVRFEPLEGDDTGRVGVLHVPMSATFVINDGQHRRAAIELAIREKPELGDDSIAVVFFQDLGLKRSQQMFADLNRHAVKPSTSIGVLYDHRDDRAEISRKLVAELPQFRDVVEMERTTLSQRSRRLFTFSAIHHATTVLLSDCEDMSIEKRVALAVSFWSEVGGQFPEWELVRKGNLGAGEIREDFIHSHGVILHALGRAGSALMAENKNWKAAIKKLSKINWARNNSKDWEGRALVNGRVSKASTNVILSANLIKRALGLELTPDEHRIEDEFDRGRNVSEAAE